MLSSTHPILSSCCQLVAVRGERITVVQNDGHGQVSNDPVGGLTPIHIQAVLTAISEWVIGNEIWERGTIVDDAGVGEVTSGYDHYSLYTA